MPSFTVTEAPQAIYPDGLQDSFIIKNEGPNTIYVDSEPTISVNSIPLPATGVLSWDSQRPLWVIAEPTRLGTDYSIGATQAQVTITRNSQIPNFSNEVIKTLFKNAQPITTTQDFVTPVLETNAFQSINIIIKNPALALAAGAAYDITKVYKLSVRWLDKELNVIAVDQINAPSECLDDPGTSAPAALPTTQTLAQAVNTKITLPVKGWACVVTINKSVFFSPGTTPTMTILGSTIARSQRLSYCVYDPLPHYASTNIGFTRVGNDEWAINVGTGGAGWCEFIIPCIKPLVTVNLTCTNAPTVAGVMRVALAGGTSWLVAPDTPIAVGAGLDTTVQFRMPLSTPVSLSFPTVPQSAGPVPVPSAQLHVVYSD